MREAPSLSTLHPLPTMTVYSSRQDWATFSAKTWGLLAKLTEKRSERNEYQATFERHLHDAMGYRAEHSDPLQF